VTDERQPAEGATSAHQRFSLAEILNTVSHDIRAALAVTSGAAHELANNQRAALGDVERQFVAMIQRGNDRLARLATNLVHLADLADGQLDLHRVRTALNTLVRQVTDELRQKYGARIRLEVVIPEAEVFALVDAERTRQVMGSILGWALASARQVVTVRLGNDGLVTIEDDGPPRGDRGRAVGEGGGKRVSSVALAYATAEGVLAAQGGSFATESLGPTSGFRVHLSLGPAA
jgi:two-component system, OmpR family, phosphate regulon sensor histidine kinase PhoR